MSKTYMPYDAACVDCRREAGKDPAGVTTQCIGHVYLERDALRQQLAAERERAETFYENYRRKCDVETKALHVALEAERAAHAADNRNNQQALDVTRGKLTEYRAEWDKATHRNIVLRTTIENLHTIIAERDRELAKLKDGTLYPQTYREAVEELAIARRELEDARTNHLDANQRVIDAMRERDEARRERDEARAAPLAKAQGAIRLAQRAMTAERERDTALALLRQAREWIGALTDYEKDISTQPTLGEILARLDALLEAQR